MGWITSQLWFLSAHSMQRQTWHLPLWLWRCCMKCGSEIWVCLFRMWLQGFGTVPCSCCSTLCCASRTHWALLEQLCSKDLYISDWIFIVHIEYLLTFSLPVNLECNQCIGSTGVIFLREHWDNCGNKITGCNIVLTWMWLPVANIF